jgi:GDP-L-fucose synthase
MEGVIEYVQNCVNYRGYQGRYVQDTSKPEGTMRKLMDVSRIRELGWEPKVGLRSGAAMTYEYFKGGSDVKQ